MPGTRSRLLTMAFAVVGMLACRSGERDITVGPESDASGNYRGRNVARAASRQAGATLRAVRPARSRRGDEMNPLTALKRPSAFLPVAMSLGALGVVSMFLALQVGAALAAMAPVFLFHWQGDNMDLGSFRSAWLSRILRLRESSTRSRRAAWAWTPMEIRSWSISMCEAVAGSGRPFPELGAGGNRTGDRGPNNVHRGPSCTRPRIRGDELTRFGAAAAHAPA